MLTENTSRNYESFHKRTDAIEEIGFGTLLKFNELEIGVTNAVRLRKSST
jgi:hypothetical protein